MYRKLIIAGAMTAAFSAPAFADWNVVKPVPGSADGGDCMVVERDATATGETKVNGPFATEAEAKAAVETTQACRTKADSSKSGSGTTPN